MAASAHKYRYNQQAGALNEVSLAAPSSMRRSIADKDAPAHGIAVAELPVSAQSRTRSSLQAQHPDWVSATSPGISLEALEALAARGEPEGRHPLQTPQPEWASLTSVGQAASQLDRRAIATGLDPTPARRLSGMFYFTVEEGQQALQIRKNGSMSVIVGPRRVWRGGSRFERMAHYVAHPGEFLIVRFRDGRQQHLTGPANVWMDPREHLEITKEDALQIAAKEAVVVYCQGEDGRISRRIVNGPEVFVPHPGEWLHTFAWHGSQGGHKGYQKVPKGLVFQKLWLMPDQMYHDVVDVRTADDAVLTIRLMLFFELSDIEKMLITTHDPIGDFVNAATSDVVDFTGRHDFDSFKKNTDKLNDLGTYRQLLARAQQCGYRIDKIVYRGYGAPESLQRMHDEAIESRTRLQLERATQQQAQELEDFKQERQHVRGARGRSEHEAQVLHTIDIERRQKEAELLIEERRRAFLREQAHRDAAAEQEGARASDAVRREHLLALLGMGVDLTRLLTQGRADQVIELRGATAGAQLHLPGPPKDAP